MSIIQEVRVIDEMGPDLDAVDSCLQQPCDSVAQISPLGTTQLILANYYHTAVVFSQVTFILLSLFW